MVWGWLDPPGQKAPFLEVSLPLLRVDYEMAPVSFIALVTGYLVCLFVCLFCFSFTGQMLPRTMTAFPTLFSHGCVCVTVLRVDSWEFLTGRDHNGKDKIPGFPSFLWVKL